MSKRLGITLTAVSLLGGALFSAPACLADSEAQLQASSYAESNNGTEEARENTSKAETQNTTRSYRENDSNSTVQARGPSSMSTLNLKEPSFSNPYMDKKAWGLGPTWGGGSVTPSLRTAPKQPVAVTPATSAPHMQIFNFQPSPARLAARPVFTSSSHRVIRTGPSSNAHYSFIKRQIKQSAVAM